MGRRKHSSKRRIIARFRMGKIIPAIAILEHRGLEQRLKPSVYLHNIDGIRLATDYEARGGWKQFAANAA
jgi:hypothetical protein